MTALALQYLLRSHRVRLNFLLALPLAIAAATQHLDNRHTAEKNAMLVIILMCTLGPAVVGSTAINLLGGLRSGLSRLVLMPNGITMYLRAGMLACTLCALCVTLLFAGCVLVTGSQLTLGHWAAVLAASTGGNLIFMQLGRITSLRAPRPVDLRSVNGWNAYSFAGGVLTVAYMLLAILCAYLVAYHHLGRTSLVPALGLGVLALLVGLSIAFLGRCRNVVSPSQQEALLASLGGTSL